VYPASSQSSSRMHPQRSAHWNWNKTRAPIIGSSKDQVSRGRYTRLPGQRAPGVVTPQATTRKGLVPQTSVTMAAHPSSGPEVVRSVPSARQETQQVGANRQAAGRADIASCLFANGRGHQKGRRRLKPLKGRTSRCNLFRVIWKWQQHLVDIFGDYGTTIRAFSVIFANIVC